MLRFLISILMFLIAIGLFIGYTRPAYDEVQELQAQGEQLDRLLGEAAEFQRIKSQLVAQYNALPSAQLARVAKMVPDHVDNVRLILDVDSLASRFSLTLEDVVINSAANSVEEESSALGAVTADRSVYDSLTLQFRTEGTYEDFLQFLQAVESSLRLVDVVDLTVSEGAQGDDLYDFEVTIRTYWIK